MVCMIQNYMASLKQTIEILQDSNALERCCMVYGKLKHAIKKVEINMILEHAI